MKAIEHLRILEIGQFCLFKRTLPEQTTLVFTGENFAQVSGLEYVTFGVRMIPWLKRTLASGHWDVVVCHCPVHPAWDARHGFVQGVRYLFHRVKKPRTLGTHFLDGDIDCPLVMLDFNDEPGIPRHVFPLLDRCALYFKRELPGDFARAFLNAAPEHRSHRMANASAFFDRNANKLRPISASVPESTAAIASSIACEKKTDVFFIGAINSTIRRLGLPVLEDLRTQGYTIDVCLGGVPKTEYLERCAAAWLTWSPEGYGWECHRHYEASLCRSVPVMNYPGIRRHQPLADRAHGFFYPIEGEGLRAAIVGALADKPVLASMAADAERHALSHHTHRQTVAHILATALSEPAAAVRRSGQVHRPRE